MTFIFSYVDLCNHGQVFDVFCNQGKLVEMMLASPGNEAKMMCIHEINLHESIRAEHVNLLKIYLVIMATYLANGGGWVNFVSSWFSPPSCNCPGSPCE